MELKRKKFETEFLGKKIVLEKSELAGQATAAMIGRHGSTTVLVTVVMSEKDKDGDYFPLMVNYEERFYATGKILGSRFMKREGRSSEEAVLTGRIVDRTIRPLFDQAIRREVQLVITVLSFDGENDPDFISLLTASTVLAISPIPWDGPVVGVKAVKFKNSSELRLNPTFSEIAGQTLDFETFVAGTKNRINMVELEGNEAKEEDVLNGFSQAHEEIKKLVLWQEKIVKEIGAKKTDLDLKSPDPKLKSDTAKFISGKLEKAVYTKDKTEMYKNISELKALLKDHLKDESYGEGDLAVAEAVFEEEINQLIHKKILGEEKRPDGRKLDEVRDLGAEVGALPLVHGSAIFMRGNTQALAVATLGAPGDQQIIESIEFSGKRRFLLHYNFPPYSVGEIGPFRAPGRREIGHGALAEKALRQLLPPKETFPYTIRLVSEILSSNGSSSMATVCAGSLALMDAGVPIRKPAAGIAMGLILDQGQASSVKRQEYKILTDIQGPEDHHGDMDFKVAGTDEGVTAVQMDVKVQGLTLEMLEKALAQAKKARLEILGVMAKALSQPRPDLAPNAPRILTLHIDPLRIGEVIGPGGKVINGIIEATGVTAIDLEDDGTVFVTATDKEKADLAVAQIQEIVKEYKIGDIVEGNIVKILEFGAIVEFGGRDGMIHVSELKEGFVKKVEDVVKLGDFVRAKIVKMDNGKIGLSIKQLSKS